MSVRIASGAKAQWAAGSGTNYVDIPEVRAWTLSTSQEQKVYASSSTGGGKQRISGSDDFEGSLSVYIDRSGTNSQDTGLGLKSGEEGTLKLFEDATNFFVAPSVIGEVSYDVPLEDGDIINGEIAFARNGALVYPPTS